MVAKASWALPALFAGMIGGAAVAGDVTAPARHAPFALYGDGLSFEVLRDDVPVGTHTVSFSRDGDDMIVDARFNLAIKFLGFTAYSMDYRSNARWRDGKLIALDARTDDEGAIKTVSARRDGPSLRIVAPDGSEGVAGDILPTNHWNVAATRQTEVLNTISGRVNRVRMRDLGAETVVAEGREIEARRWTYTGELQNEVWYDRDGRWVKMRFQGKDGSTIEYVCTRCLGASRSAADR